MVRARKPSANRTDLLVKQPTAAPTGLPYGEHQQLVSSQQGQPLAGQQQMEPRQLLQLAQNTPAPPPIHAPTAQPNEPLTTGLSTGPGAGPEVLSTPAPDPTVNMLQGLYSKFPIKAVHDLLLEAQRRAGQ